MSKLNTANSGQWNSWPPTSARWGPKECVGRPSPELSLAVLRATSVTHIRPRAWVSHRSTQSELGLERRSDLKTPLGGRRALGSCNGLFCLCGARAKASPLESGIESRLWSGPQELQKLVNTKGLQGPFCTLTPCRGPACLVPVQVEAKQRQPERFAKVQLANWACWCWARERH